MNILISNDDGINAKGLNILKEILIKNKHNVFIVAPERNQSATSHSLTLDNPLRIKKIDNNTYSTTGTPTDCVLIATHGLIKEKIDLVISGINHGPNMGEDVFYSGTVAAAMEGIMMGIKSIAISLASFEDLEFSASEYVILKLIKIVKKCKKRVFLNVNIPNEKKENIKGFKITRLGTRIYSDILIEKTDPRGKKYYWIGGQKPKFKKMRGTDFEAIEKKYVSITPLKMDLTDNDLLKNLKKVL